MNKIKKYIQTSHIKQVVGRNNEELFLKLSKTIADQILDLLLQIRMVQQKIYIQKITANEEIWKTG